MSSIGDLGLEESCELAVDIGRSNKRNKGFTQLQALNGGNPTCCLSDLFNMEKYRVTMGWISANISWLGFDAWFEVLAMGGLRF